MSQIKKLLNDSSEDVKLNAALALGRLGDVSGIPLAKKFISHTDSQKRIRSAEIFGVAGMRDDIILLKQVAASDNNSAVKNAAQQAINFIQRRFPEASKKK